MRHISHSRLSALLRYRQANVGILCFQIVDKAIFFRFTWTVVTFCRGILTSKKILTKMKELLSELWDFIKVRKKYWLTPVIIVLLILGALLILSSGSAIAPFIYTIF